MATLATFGSGGFLRGSLTGKSSIRSSNFFGGIGGKAVTTPTFELGEGGLSRTDPTQSNIGRQIESGFTSNLGRIKPGFGQLSEAVKTAFARERGRVVGNLRSQLGRRGILGASFAQDAITRTELDISQREAEALAQVEAEELKLELENLRLQSAFNIENITAELRELALSFDFITNLNSIEQRRFEFEQEFARSRQGGIRFGRSFSRFGPGGPLGSFSRFGSPTNRAGPATFGGSTGIFSQPGRTGPLTFESVFRQPSQTTSSFVTT